MSDFNNTIIRFNNYQKEVFTNLYNTEDKANKVLWGIFYGISAIAIGVTCSTITAQLLGYRFTIIDSIKKDVIFIDDAAFLALSPASLIDRITLKIFYPLASVVVSIPIVVIVPVIQELVYRELIQNEILKNKLKPLLSLYCPKLSNSNTTMKIVQITVTNILFTLHHLPDFYMRIKSSKNISIFITYYFGMGLAFSAAREHKDVFTSIVAHATLNSLFIVARQVFVVAYLYFNHRFDGI